MYEAFINSISNIINKDNIHLNQPMSKHTTFKVGGVADILVEPENVNQLIEILSCAKEYNVPYFVMGNGSNLLVGDKGIRGLVIKIANAMSRCEVHGEYIKAECGIKLSRLANNALASCLTGLEFASGIPGTLGGAVFMNAGAYGGEMKDIIKEVKYFDIEKNEVITISGEDCEFGYRHSIFSDLNAVILEATMKLAYGEADEIRSVMNDLATRRNEKQPVDKPSAGSTFKRPEGYFAGTMIQDCGLKGHSIGGAQVSEKHAGFVINTGDATARDISELIEYVQEKVEEKYGVVLEPEVRFVGEFQ